MICSNLLAHVHEIEYKCMWAVKWVASNPQMVDRDAPITNLQGQQNISNQRLCGVQSRQHFINCGVFYIMPRVLENAAKISVAFHCGQNFGSMSL